MTNLISINQGLEQIKTLFENAIKVYKNSDELKADGLLSNESDALLNNMTFDNFITDLVRIYEKRFGTGKLS